MIVRSVFAFVNGNSIISDNRNNDVVDDDRHHDPEGYYNCLLQFIFTNLWIRPRGPIIETDRWQTFYRCIKRTFYSDRENSRLYFLKILSTWKRLFDQLSKCIVMLCVSTILYLFVTIEQRKRKIKSVLCTLICKMEK